MYCSDKDSRECTPSSPNAHFFGQRSSAATQNSTASDANNNNNSNAASKTAAESRLKVLSSSTSGSGDNDVTDPFDNSVSESMTTARELIAKEKTIDSYVNFKRYL